jgi:hypothetical protein
MPFAVVQVREDLALEELYILFWNSLTSELGEVNAARVVKYPDSRYISREAVTARVREQLGWYGSRSVEGGPHTDYPSAEFEAALKAIVAKAYRLTY